MPGLTHKSSQLTLQTGTLLLLRTLSDIASTVMFLVFIF